MSEILGVYLWVDINDNPMYIGSSRCSIDGVEYNHRHLKEKGYDCLVFREALCREGQDWIAIWLDEPALRTRKEIETLEEEWMKKIPTKWNRDLHPTRSSAAAGRHDEGYKYGSC